MDAVSAANNSNMFGQATSGSGGDELGKSDFLLLLVTQFQYQDPLNPMEDKEFIAQLAQFSSLEQLMNLNESMLGLTDASRENQILTATSFIGKTVTGNGNTISVEGDEPIPRYQYATAESMVKGTIKVFNVSNELIYTEDLGPRQQGVHDFDWNGKLNSGAKAADGIYYVQVESFNIDGDPLQIAHQVEGVVKGISLEYGELQLVFKDNRTLPLSSVRLVSAVGESIEDIVYQEDPALEEIKSEMKTFTETAIAAMEAGTVTKEDTKALVKTKLEEGAVEVKAWSDEVLADKKYTKKETRELVDRAHAHFTALYEQIDEHTFDSDNDDAPPPPASGASRSAQSAPQSEEAYNKATKEIRQWADKSLQDGTHTIEEIRTIVAQKFKELNS